MNATVCGQHRESGVPWGSVGWRQGVRTGGPGLDPYCWLGLAGRGGEGLRVNWETSHTKGKGSWEAGGGSQYIFHAD